MSSATHVVLLAVGNAEKCKAASDRLLEQHGLYVEPINSPAIPQGGERLRITPTPHHDDKRIDWLAEALIEVWEALGLPPAFPPS